MQGHAATAQHPAKPRNNDERWHPRNRRNSDRALEKTGEWMDSWMHGIAWVHEWVVLMWAASTALHVPTQAQMIQSLWVFLRRKCINRITSNVQPFLMPNTAIWAVFVQTDFGGANTGKFGEQKCFFP